MGRGRAGRGVLRSASLAVFVALVTGCTQGTPANSGPPVVTAAADQQDLLGPWHDTQGRNVPDGSNAAGGILVIHSGAGSTSCSKDNVTVFLELAWPPGRRLDWTQSHNSDDTYRYVRETEGSWMHTDGESDLDTTLPSSARSTGLNSRGNTVYAIGAKPSAIWVRRADQRIERWARLDEHAGCA